MDGRDIDGSRTKWWGVDRHIVIYYTTAARSEIYFVTSVPEPAEWVTPESWSTKGELSELRAGYEGFHADVRAVLDACPECHKWAILEREPLPRWSDGRVVLLGDACHPMTPYMAQGAATSIEDAAVLARCFEAASDIESAFALYEAHRKPRTSRIQAISSANTWMQGGDTDTSWLYGYRVRRTLPADKLIKSKQHDEETRHETLLTYDDFRLGVLKENDTVVDVTALVQGHSPYRAA